MKARTTGVYLSILVAAIGALALVVSRSLSVEVVYPVEHASHIVSSTFLTRLKDLFCGRSVAAENRHLKREIAHLKLLRGDNERLLSENHRLRRALNYLAKDPGTWLAAGVLSRGGGAVGSCDSLRVDKGSLVGVKVGAVVAVPEGLVGRVVSVTPHTANVMLLTDASLKVACEIETKGAARVFGILSGGADDSLIIRHLKNAEGVSPHSKVLTSGRGGIFPRGLEVGTLLDIRKDARGLAREGEVLPPVGFSTLEDVFIRCER